MICSYIITVLIQHPPPPHTHTHTHTHRDEEGGGGQIDRARWRKGWRIERREERGP